MLKWIGVSERTTTTGFPKLSNVSCTSPGSCCKQWPRTDLATIRPSTKRVRSGSDRNLSDRSCSSEDSASRRRDRSAVDELSLARQTWTSRVGRSRLPPGWHQLWLRSFMDFYNIRRLSLIRLFIALL